MTEIIEGMAICLTGTFNVGLDTLTRRVQHQGAVVMTDPGAHFVVCGRDPDRALLAEAEKEGTQIVGLDDLVALRPLHRFVERLDLASEVFCAPG